MRQFALNKRTMVVMAGIAACMVLMAVFLYLPLSRSIRKAGLEWRGLNQLLSSAEAHLSVFQGASAGKRLIREEGISSVIDRIAQEGRNNLLDFKSIRQDNIRDVALNHQVLPVVIEIEGEYKQLGIFLGALENIKDSLVSVEEFSITGGEKILPKVSASIALNIHLTKD